MVNHDVLKHPENIFQPKERKRERLKYMQMKNELKIIMMKRKYDTEICIVD